MTSGRRTAGADAWREAALRLGASAVIDETGARPARRLEATLDGMILVAETSGVRPDHNDWFPGTQVRLGARIPAGSLVLTVHERPGSLVERSSDLRADGADAALFANQFEIATSDDLAAAFWLDDEVRAWILRTRGYRFEIHDGLVWAAYERLEHQAEVLEAAVRSVAALATRATRARATWRDALERLGLHADGDGELADTLELAFEAGGERRRVALHFRTLGVAGPPRLSTVLTAERRGSAGDRFFGARASLALEAPRGLSAVVSDLREFSFAGSDRRVLTARLARPLGAALESCGEVAVLADARAVDVALPGFVNDAIRLRAALALLAILADDVGPVGSAGPYR